MPGKLQIANLSRTAEGLNLEVLFSPHGTVNSAKIVTDPNDRSRNTGVGQVEMSTEKEATAAIAALNGRLYCGSTLKVGWAAPPNQADPLESLKSGLIGSLNATEPYDVAAAASDFGNRGGSDSSGVAKTIVSDADLAEQLAARIGNLEIQAGSAGVVGYPYRGEAASNADAPLRPTSLSAAAANPVIQAAVAVVNAANGAADAAKAVASKAADAATRADKAAAHAGAKPGGEAMSTANRAAEQNAHAANKAADAAADLADVAAEQARKAEVAASLLVKA